MKWSRFVIWMPLSISLIGCGDQDNLPSGKYYGTLTIQKPNELQVYEVYTVIDESSAHRSKLTVALSESSSKEIIASLEVKASKDKIRVRSNLIFFNEEIELKREGSCARNEPDAESRYEACFSKSKMSFVIESKKRSASDYRRIYLYLSHAERMPESDSKVQKAYSLDELIQRVKTSNIGNRIEAEKAFRALEEISVARGMALPHFNSGTLIKAVQSTTMYDMMGTTMGRTSALGLLGDLVPFLFPSRWFNVERSKAFFAAEKYSYSVIIANQVNLAEGLFLSIQRDQQFLSELRKNLGFLEDIESLLKQRQSITNQESEKLVLVQNNILKKAQDIHTLENMLAHSYPALERSANLPLIVKIKLLTPVRQPLRPLNERPHSANNYYTEALAKSLELKQIVELRRAALAEQSSRTWAFLDPGSDPKLSLGLGYAANLKISKSNIRELDLKYEDTENAIQEHVTRLLSLLHTAAEHYQHATDAFYNTSDLLDLKAIEVKINGNYRDLMGLIKTVDELFAYQLKRIETEAFYLIVSSKLKRLLLRGHYEDVYEVAQKNIARAGGSSK